MQLNASSRRFLGPVLLSMCAKLGTAPLVAICWFVATRMTLADLGIDNYAVFTIAVSVAVILPFADLGLGASVMDAAARKRHDLAAVVVTSLRWLFLVAGFLVSAAGVMALNGWFSALMGVEPTTDTEVSLFVAVGIFACGLPWALTGRLYTGGGRNTTAVLLQALPAILTLALVVVGNGLGLGIKFYAAAPFVAALLVNFVFFPRALSSVGLAMRPIVRELFSADFKSVRVRGVAGPMLVITLVLPVAYQLDRIFLSRQGSAYEVAQYSVAYQVFAPLIAALGAGAVALWPIFSGERSSGNLSWESFRRTLLAFVVLGLGLGGALAVIGPYVGAWVSGSALNSEREVYWAFAALLLVQSMSYPMAMLLTTESDLRTQVGLHLAMLSLNLPLTIWWASALGAKGPVLASVLAVLICMLTPQLFLAKRALSGR